MHSVLTLLPIAFVLSLDNVQSSIGLGTTKPSGNRIVQCALVFGVFDALAPTLGVWVGDHLGGFIGPYAEYIGAAFLGVYAVYLGVRAMCTEKAEDLDHSYAILGLPLALSIDNLVAGVGLGVMGYSAVIVAVLAGIVTAVMSAVGLVLGKLAAGAAPIRTDLFAGAVLLVMSCVMAFQG